MTGITAQIGRDKEHQRCGSGVLEDAAQPEPMTDSADAQQERSLLEAIFSSLDFGIISITPAGTVETWNKGAERIFGYSAEEITGKSVSVLAPSEGSLPYTEAFDRVSASGEQDTEVVRIRKDGTRINVALSLSPIRDASGEITGVAAIAQDIASRKQKEEIIRRSETEYRFLFDSNPIPMWVFDRSTLHFLEVNDAAAHQYGFSRSEFLRMSITDIRPAETIPGLLRDIAERREGLQSRACWQHRRKNGEIFDVEIVCHDLPFRGVDALLVAAYDVTERKQAQEAVRRAEENFRAIFDEAAIGIFQHTPDGRPLNINPALAHMHGYNSPEHLMSEVSNVAEQLFVNPGQLAELARAAAENETIRNAEVELYRRDRSRIWVMVNLRAIRDSSGRVIVYQGTAEDITDRKAAEAQVRFLAYHDSLTRLPNRTLFGDRLDLALAGARRKSEKVAVLFLDLDRFKNINDLLGHSVGDQLLVEVAARLTGCVREQDTVTRVGGDEFLILLSDISSIEEAEIAARRIMIAITQTIWVQENALNTSCSIGISMFPDHGRDGETLIRNADAAMYRAKEEGPNHVESFSVEMSSRAIEQWTLENDLRAAVKRAEFLLVYQPQMEIASGKITGVEALIRWQHPTRGLISPATFIPIAESCGLIVPIGEWVLRTACSAARAWQHEGFHTAVAVNVSAAQFRNRDFCSLIKRVLTETGVPPECLQLELTESLLLSNADVVHAVLQELRDLGITLAIDDFGTGYSSLSYLKQLHVRKLKIDRSFIHDIARGEDDAAITTAIISMARSLNLRVTAEGVETEEQFAFLREKGCDEIQGFYLCKPVPATDMPGVMSTWLGNTKFAPAAAYDNIPHWEMSKA